MGSGVDRRSRPERATGGSSVLARIPSPQMEDDQGWAVELPAVERSPEQVVMGMEESVGVKSGGDAPEPAVAGRACGSDRSQDE